MREAVIVGTARTPLTQAQRGESNIPPRRLCGARLAGHVLLEGRRRRAKYAVVSLCIIGGISAAALFEIY